MGRRLAGGMGMMALVVVACGRMVQADHAETTRLAELDALWGTVSQAVATGDFEAYAATCHPDGVLVIGRRQRTEPLAVALQRWQKDFDDTRAGRMKASASVRWSTRYGDATTAYEVGILRYASQPTGEEEKVEYVDFEVVLVKRDDGWKVTCENQKGVTTEKAWNALKPTK
jgi:ketosteroid isomerase-like protein